MIDILDSLSEPGSRINEDAWGHAGLGAAERAWVLDGATGVAGREHVPGASSDAAWLAANLSRHLEALEPEGDVAGYFATVLEHVRADYAAAVPDFATLPSYALPSAAGIWAQLTEDRLELAWLGDCVAVVLSEDAVHVAGAAEAVDHNLGINRAVAERLAAGPVSRPMLELLTDELRARRSGLNRPGGFWMFGIEPGAVAGLRRLTVTLAAPALMLLCSDGFWRLVDHFRAYDERALVLAAHARGLAVLCAELRRHEATDPEGRRFPRVKCHDDATALLCRLYPPGLKT